MIKQFLFSVVILLTAPMSVYASNYKENLVTSLVSYATSQTSRLVDVAKENEGDSVPNSNGTVDCESIKSQILTVLNVELINEDF